MTAPVPPLDAPYLAWAGVSEVARWFGEEAGGAVVRHSLQCSPTGVEDLRAFVPLGPPTARRSAMVRQAVCGLGAPAEVVDLMEEGLGAAIAIHVGHRAGRGRETAKLYLEFDPCRSGAPDPTLRLVGLKWRLDGSGRYSVSEYREAGGAGDLLEAVAPLLPPGGPGDVLAVTDRNGGARSAIDVGLPEPWRPLGEVEPLVRSVCEALGLALDSGAVGRFADCELGRLAVGTRSGAPFLTAYLTAPGVWAQNDAK